jgi:hypothetical protein
MENDLLIRLPADREEPKSFASITIPLLDSEIAGGAADQKQGFGSELALQCLEIP